MLGARMEVPMKYVLIALCLISSAIAADRTSYLYPSYTTAENYTRLGLDGRMALGPAVALHAKFFTSETEVTGDDLETWEARAGASFLTSQGYLFQLLGVHRDEPGPVKAQGIAPSVHVPLNQIWGSELSTVAGLDMEFIKFTGLPVTDEMLQVLFGPSVRQELIEEKIFLTLGHDQYFYDEDNLFARGRLNGRLATFANSGAILLGLPDNTTYARLDTYPIEMLSISPRLSTSKSLELDNRTFVMAVGAWLKLPFLSLGVDVGSQKTKNGGDSENFVGFTVAL
jgi:hypothetical protein